MPIYSYKVKDQAGNTRTGTLEAESERAAAAMIREAGGLPMEIKPVRGQGSDGATLADGPAGNAIVRYLVHPFWTGVNIRHLVFFFRQLSTLLAAGVPLSEALRNISERTAGSIGRIVMMAHLRVQNGGRLSDEMSRHPRVFAPLQVSLVRAGEQGGMLEAMLEKIASYLEYEISIRRKMIMASFYPVILLILIFLRPTVVTWIMGSNEQALAVFKQSLVTTLVPILVVIAAAKFLFQFEGVRLVWDAIKIGPPVLGPMAHKISMARFSRAFALLYSSGIPVAQALSISADASANVMVARRLKRAIPAVNEGQRLSEALQRTYIVIPVVMDMLIVGEKTGSYDMTLQKVASYMEEEADSTIHKLSIVLFVLLILIVALMIGGTALSTIRGVSDTYNKQL